jgi:CHAT domain-containing protein
MVNMSIEENESLDDLDRIQEEFQTFLSSLETKLQNGGRRDLPDESYDLRQVVKNMGDGVVLLQMIPVPKCLWLILTTPDFTIRVMSPVPQGELAIKVAEFRKLLENPRSDVLSDVLPLAKELYDILIAPVAEELEKAETRTLMLSLNGVLRYIPMAALHDGDEWLVEKYATALYTGEPNKKAEDESLASKRRLMLINDMSTTTHLFRQELHVLEEFFSGEIKINRPRSKSAFSDALDKRVFVLHFFDAIALNGRADLSRTRYGLFTFEEMMNFEDHKFGNVELLFFTSVRTTMKFSVLAEGDFYALDLSRRNKILGTRNRAGQEVEGLGVWARKRGVNTIVATLWQSRRGDFSKEAFSVRFYEYLLNGNLSKAEALRRLQLDFLSITSEDSPFKYMLRQMGRFKGRTYGGFDYRHPFFWARYIMMGNE